MRTLRPTRTDLPSQRVAISTWLSKRKKATSMSASRNGIRSICNGFGFLLTAVAYAQHAWTVITPTLQANTEPEEQQTRTLDAGGVLALSPSQYCLDFSNGTFACHHYAAEPTPPNSIHSINLKHLQEQAIANQAVSEMELLDVGVPPDSVETGFTNSSSSPSQRLESAVSVWCRSSSNDAWTLVHDFESALCVATLDACATTAWVWLITGACCAFLTSLEVVKCLAKSTRASSLASGACLTKLSSAVTIVHCLLSVLVVMNWWGYATYLLDVAKLEMLHLHQHYGPSFRLAVISMVLSMVASWLTLEGSGTHYGRLYQTPQNPQTTTSSNSSIDTSNPLTLESEDPLNCPANYNV